MKKTEHVDAFGLNEFGQPAGLNPVWGAVVGTGLGTLGAIGARQFGKTGGKMSQYSELVGLGMGALASGAMAFFDGTRAAGWTGLAAVALNNGLRQLEQSFFAKKANGIEGTVIDPTTSFSAAAFRPTTSFSAATDTPPSGPMAQRKGRAIPFATTAMAASMELGGPPNRIASPAASFPTTSFLVIWPSPRPGWIVTGTSPG